MGEWSPPTVADYATHAARDAEYAAEQAFRKNKSLETRVAALEEIVKQIQLRHDIEDTQ